MNLEELNFTKEEINELKEWQMLLSMIESFAGAMKKKIQLTSG